MQRSEDFRSIELFVTLVEAKRKSRQLGAARTPGIRRGGFFPSALMPMFGFNILYLDFKYFVCL
jgi:hypothetical protein